MADKQQKSHKAVNVDKLMDKFRSKSESGATVHAPAYGARYFSEPVPKYEMREESMPAKVAYQIIHDETNIEGNPAQNLATFVTSWMEPEAVKLIQESLDKNFIDFDEYPQTQEIHQRCVSIIGDLFHVPKKEGESTFGTCTIGSSEAFMLAGLAMKFKWRNARKAKNLPCDKPNIIMGNNAQVALEKFALYFDVEVRFVPVTPSSNYVMDPKRAVALVDENTVGIVSILGSTFTGHFENVKELNTLLTEVNAKNGWNVPIHVDGASGAFVAPFRYPDLEWDFRLPLVRSINTSGHKYGLVYPGVGWCIWRERADLPEELIFKINYLGGEFPSFTLNFSKSASQVISQYYNFLRLGKSGYKSVMDNCCKNALFLGNCLRETGYYKIRSDADTGLPLVAFSILDPNVTFDEHDLSDKVRQKGWIVPAYGLPKDSEDITVIRVVVRESHSEDIMENLVKDFVWAYETLRDKKWKQGKHDESVSEGADGDKNTFQRPC